MKTGGPPPSRRAGSARAISSWSGSYSWWTVAARRPAVALLPMPFAPSIAIAGRLGSSSSSSASMIRGLYGWSPILFLLRCYAE
jgi:hypothetical protein